MDTKDRIKHLMEVEHMTQQEFADFLQQSPATLSSIFNGRTRPTMNVVDSIKAKIPDISLEWLLYGQGDMYRSHPERVSEQEKAGAVSPQEATLNFDVPSSEDRQQAISAPQPTNFQQGVRNTPSNSAREEIKIFDKQPRRVTEIRVYYDDRTYETFVPSKN
jgi:transcriptional regulator with XRE-family HTH domain